MPGDFRVNNNRRPPCRSGREIVARIADNGPGTLINKVKSAHGCQSNRTVFVRRRRRRIPAEQKISFARPPARPAADAFSRAVTKADKQFKRQTVVWPKSAGPRGRTGADGVLGRDGGERATVWESIGLKAFRRYPGIRFLADERLI